MSWRLSPLIETILSKGRDGVANHPGDKGMQAKSHDQDQQQPHRQRRDRQQHGRAVNRFNRSHLSLASM